MTNSEKHSAAIKAAQTNRALGTFLTFFGIVVLISIFFTETDIGKLTNLIAGGIITGIGSCMFLWARSRLVRLSQTASDIRS